MNATAVCVEHPCSTIIGSVTRFLTVLTEKTQSLGICIRDKEIDHVCYRCSTVTEYQQVCRDLQVFGEILLESMIGGRPIAMVSLNEPIVFYHWSVRCVEVTCPKPGKVHQQGLEHAEVVVGSPKDGIYHSAPLLHAFQQLHPSVQFDNKAIHKEANADVSITLLEGMSVKFHVRPVYEVIAEELQAGHVVAIPDGYFAAAKTAESAGVVIPAANVAVKTTCVPLCLAGAASVTTFPPPEESDGDVAALLSDPWAMQHLVAMSKPSCGGWSKQDAAARRVRQTAEYAAGSSFNGIIATAAGEFAGIGGLRSIDWWSRSAEMGIILRPCCWRKGLSVEVHYLCFVHAFEELCLNRIEFKTASSNTAMVAFCKEVLSANHDGTLRDAFPANDTADIFRLYCNVELFSVLSGEWPALKTRLRERMDSTRR